MLMENLVRTGAGQFEPRLTSREVDNFPLANITHPDYDRHPLLRDAHVMTVEVPAGSALFLPAYWFHQVERSPEMSREHPRSAEMRCPRLLAAPGGELCRSRRAQRRRQLLVPGPLARHPPLPNAARERLCQLHAARGAGTAAPVPKLGLAGGRGMRGTSGEAGCPPVSSPRLSRGIPICFSRAIPVQ